MSRGQGRPGRGEDGRSGSARLVDQQHLAEPCDPGSLGEHSPPGLTPRGGVGAHDALGRASCHRNSSPGHAVQEGTDQCRHRVLELAEPDRSLDDPPLRGGLEPLRPGRGVGKGVAPDDQPTVGRCAHRRREERRAIEQQWSDPVVWRCQETDRVRCTKINSETVGHNRRVTAYQYRQKSDICRCD